MQVVYRQRRMRDAPLPRDSDEALAWLADGNRRFSSLAAVLRDDEVNDDTALVIESDFAVSAVLGRTPEPRPFGVVLGCADSRVPVELLFGRPLNDLFIVRVAGNTLGADSVGSIDYAVRHFSTIRTIVILGHTRCGAVATAVDVFLRPRGVLDLAISLPMRSLVDRIQVGVRAASMALQQAYGLHVAEEPGYGWALLDLAVFINTAYVAYSVRAGLPADIQSRTSVVYGVYDVVTQRVSAMPAGSTAFGAPPDDAVGFQQLGQELAATAAVREMLRAESRV